ncbi:uncharacterized protein LOC119681310 [Teleopsis dalmanni]|uniref:uncharacterized protein LOC119681310 n=1 Tax=Teleopsis dalmanni TaxID=139649 RepID=UPI0018CCBE88|nr:uncharacterized protein LOC119681310 [Teleopsis dalmanni]
MSAFNFMDGVPVKISEKYKPPPRIYQVPQAIVNKLTISESHYSELPSYTYDFHLERKVLTKIPEWRRMRKHAEEARAERRQQREQQKLQDLEAQQKQLLGAVSYPSTEELSSSNSEDEDKVVSSPSEKELTRNDEIQTSSPYVYSFNDILQPTILPRNDRKIKNNCDVDINIITQVGNVVNAKTLSNQNSFNYKDFEDDTSSPFDNIELKTINDLDILAQVLHNTQLSKNLAENDEENNKTKEGTQSIATTTTNDLSQVLEYSDVTNNVLDPDKLKIIEHTNAALKQVDFSSLSQQFKHENIPNATALVFQNQLNDTDTFITRNKVNPLINNTPMQTQQTNYFPFNAIHNDVEHISQQQQQQQQQQYLNYNLQCNNLSFYGGSCNGGSIGYFSPTHITHLVGNNTNNYLHPDVNKILSNMQYIPSTVQSAENVDNAKSKSVPNIIKELSDEVRFSEMRRSRNHSYNLEDSKEQNILHEQEKEEEENQKKSNESHCYTQLEVSAQKLAKSISSMGFPLERVAKIAKIFGTDDKKIIEHLIPLSELMDLGFDEAAISEALMKCDNNKEKALEYLIS